MKNRIITKLIYLLIIFLLPHTVKSQLGWFLQQSGTTQTLHSVYFFDLNTGFAAGTNGVLLKTTNGGTNWIQQYTGTNNSFLSMHFPTSNTGYIVGYGGVLVKTTNGGLNWNLYPAGTNQVQFSIYFIDAYTGYTVSSNYSTSGLVNKTTNGGLNWSSYQIGPGYYNSIYFTDVNTGFITNSYSNNFGDILKTTNGGMNWVVLESPPNGEYSGLFMNNATTGYAAGTKIVKTTNAGINWTLQYSQQSTLLSIFFVDLNIGYSAGSFGNIVKTTNGGSSWTLQQNLATSNVLRDIQFLNANTGYAVGDNGTIIKTTSGGEPIGIKPKSEIIPKEYSLSQNYPNPFNPSTKIEFQIPKSSYVKMSVFDILGKEIEILVNEKLKPGIYEVTFEGKNCPTSVYFYRMEAGNNTATKKMLLIK